MRTSPAILLVVGLCSLPLLHASPARADDRMTRALIGALAGATLGGLTMAGSVCGAAALDDRTPDCDAVGAIVSIDIGVGLTAPFASAMAVGGSDGDLAAGPLIAGGIADLVVLVLSVVLQCTGGLDDDTTRTAWLVGAPLTLAFAPVLGSW